MIAFAVDLSSEAQNITVTKMVTLTDRLVAEILPLGDSEQSHSFAEELRLEATTSLTASCTLTDTSGIQLQTTWQIMEAGVWKSLEEAGLVDVSPLPNTLALAAFALVPGSHQIRASVAIQGSASSASTIYTVTVTDTAPAIEILGSNSVGVGCGIELDALVAGPLHPQATLTYSWSCLQPAGCSFSGLTSSSANLVVDGAETVAGSYAFSTLAASCMSPSPNLAPRCDGHTADTQPTTDFSNGTGLAHPNCQLCICFPGRRCRGRGSHPSSHQYSLDDFGAYLRAGHRARSSTTCHRWLDELRMRGTLSQ